MEGGRSDSEEEGEGEGGEGGDPGLPVRAEGVGEGGQGEVEEAKQAGQCGQQKDGQYLPVVQSCSLPWLVGGNLVQNEDSPEKGERSEEDDVGDWIDETEEGLGKCSDKNLRRHVGQNLGKTGSDKEAIVDCHVEVVDAEAHHEPDEGGEDERGEKALDIEDKVVIVRALAHHRQLTGDSGVGREDGEAAGA